MGPVRLNHLQDEVVVLAVNVEEQLFLLKRLRTVVCGHWPRPLLLVVIRLVPDHLLFASFRFHLVLGLARVDHCACAWRLCSLVSVQSDIRLGSIARQLGSLAALGT